QRTTWPKPAWPAPPFPTARSSSDAANGLSQSPSSAVLLELGISLLFGAWFLVFRFRDFSGAWCLGFGVSSLVLCHLQFQVQIAQLPRGHGRGRVCHQVGALGGLRKRDHIADARCAAEYRHQAVEAERDPSVRRRAVTKGFQHVAEAQFRLLGRN